MVSQTSLLGNIVPMEPPAKDPAPNQRASPEFQRLAKKLNVPPPSTYCSIIDADERGGMSPAAPPAGNSSHLLANALRNSRAPSASQEDASSAQRASMLQPHRPSFQHQRDGLHPAQRCLPSTFSEPNRQSRRRSPKSAAGKGVAPSRPLLPNEHRDNGINQKLSFPFTPQRNRTSRRPLPLFLLPAMSPIRPRPPFSVKTVYHSTPGHRMNAVVCPLSPMKPNGRCPKIGQASLGSSGMSTQNPGPLGLLRVENLPADHTISPSYETRLGCKASPAEGRRPPIENATAQKKRAFPKVDPARNGMQDRRRAEWSQPREPHDAAVATKNFAALDISPGSYVPLLRTRRANLFTIFIPLGDSFAWHPRWRMSVPPEQAPAPPRLLMAPSVRAAMLRPKADTV